MTCVEIRWIESFCLIDTLIYDTATEARPPSLFQTTLSLPAQRFSFQGVGRTKGWRFTCVTSSNQKNNVPALYSSCYVAGGLWTSCCLAAAANVCFEKRPVGRPAWVGSAWHWKHAPPHSSSLFHFPLKWSNVPFQVPLLKTKTFTGFNFRSDM